MHKAPDFVHLLHFCTAVNLLNKHSAGHDSLKLNRWHWFTQFLPVVLAKVITVLQRLVGKDVSFCMSSGLYVVGYCGFLGLFVCFNNCTVIKCFQNMLSI